MQHLATKIAQLETRHNRCDNRSTSAQPVHLYPGQLQPRSTATRHPRNVNDRRQSTDRYRTPADRQPPIVDRRHNKRPVDFRQSPNTGQRPRKLLCYECGHPSHLDESGQGRETAARDGINRPTR